MDEDHDLRDFDNVCRLFPLPGVVLFPHSVLKLHIFEPRYRQMTQDALATDRLIAIVQIRPTPGGATSDEPELEPVGCLGRIFKHERLPDGRFNLLLLGRKRIRLDRELANGKLYRSSEVSIIEDGEADDSVEALRPELIALFRRAYRAKIDADLDALFETELPLGVLADIVAQAMGLPAGERQEFLAEAAVGRRVLALLERLRAAEGGVDAGESRPSFPPPFSRN